jgi:hypothetical protein
MEKDSIVMEFAGVGTSWKHNRASYPQLCPKRAGGLDRAADRGHSAAGMTTAAAQAGDPGERVQDQQLLYRAQDLAAR